MGDLLLPGENIVLTIARAQVERGEAPIVHMSAALIATIDRIIKLIDGRSLFVECEHVQAETFCDPLCDAYVHGEGMIRIWSSENNDD